MTATCHPIPPAVAHEMMQGIVRALCDRPEQSAAEHAALTRGVVYSVMSFAPRDPMEIMLAGAAVAHFHLMLDAARDTLCGRLEDRKARHRSGVVGIDRAMTNFIEELRTSQTRPLVGGAENAGDAAAPEPESAAAEAPLSADAPDPADAASPCASPDSPPPAAEPTTPDAAPPPTDAAMPEDEVPPMAADFDPSFLDNTDGTRSEDVTAFRQVLEATAATADHEPDQATESIAMAVAG